MARIVEIMSSPSDVNKETKASVHVFEYCLLDSLEFSRSFMRNSK
ncbi:4792_t:CDS:2 [Diversispora eburnea]|uniref:4792_t:CDS:1 n=1 Tax=Diversispora eburnea TaxID=1213867 RepID=A0A9N9FP55_9GLOM|nr:4792_t:CDS:2 [Diversispora eburnea]